MKYEETLRQGKILIVDDEVGNLCMLENILNRLGFPNLRKLADSSRILAEYDSYQPDLVMTDLEMPALNGVDVVKQLRGHVTGDGFLPVLVLTGSVDAQKKRQALLAGATDLISKPFDSSELQLRIRNLLQIRFQRQEIQNQNAGLELKVAERTSELKRALTDLQNSQRQVVQQERLRAFGEMAGGVVHDFNNSLMSIIGYSELLLEHESLSGDPAMVREYLQTMNTAGRDAAEVISRLRDFYRPREATDVFAATDVNHLLEEIVPLTRPKWHDQALKTGRVIHVKLELRKVPPVFGNGAELRQVLTNLLFNAVDAMPTGGTITLRTQQEGGSVVIEVADTGQGMTEEVRQRCQEPFFSTKGEGGTGLGLSMSSGIIRRHEGAIEIESAPARGTTFRLRLPVHHAVGGTDDRACHKLSRRLRVVVVDDHASTREIVTRYLQGDGHEVATVASGAEAIEVMLKNNFDVLITDHGMPGMSGAQLARFVRKMYPEIGIILLSGFATALEEKPPSVNQMLKKPLMRDELRRALQAAMPVNAPPPRPALAGAAVANDRSPVKPTSGGRPVTRRFPRASGTRRL